MLAMAQVCALSASRALGCTRVRLFAIPERRRSPQVRRASEKIWSNVQCPAWYATGGCSQRSSYDSRHVSSGRVYWQTAYRVHQHPRRIW